MDEAPSLATRVVWAAVGVLIVVWALLYVLEAWERWQTHRKVRRAVEGGSVAAIRVPRPWPDEDEVPPEAREPEPEEERPAEPCEDCPDEEEADGEG